MSLIKQLWIAIVVVSTLAFGGSLVVSTLAARHYLEQQLQVKNLDNATSLALSLSQMPKDPVTVELQIAAQFDAGHYSLIRLTEPGGGPVIVERTYADPETGAPEWFVRLVPIETRPGVAQVQDGWHQFGTLTLESHKRYAYQALWDGTVHLLLWFLLGGAITGGVGTLLIKHITRPLGRVVAQAEAIGGRRFVTTEEPNTTEFRSVVRAMNALSERVRTMLAEESQRLEQLRRQNQHDELTGLVNRNQFMNTIDAALARDDAAAGGSLVIARVGDLAGLNRVLGRRDVDGLLCAVADRFQTLADAHSGWEAGRLNSTDFALLATGGADAGEVSSVLSATLIEAQDAWRARAPLRLAAGISTYRPGEPRGTVLARVDGALASAEQGDDSVQIVVAPTDDMPLYPDLPGWRRALTTALEGNRVKLAAYPVVSASGVLLHHEAPLRLELDRTWYEAGHFMPWANRLGLMSRVDAAVVRAALTRIAADDRPIAINLSVEALCDAGFRGELFAALQVQPHAAPKLWIELPEAGVLRHLSEFRALCIALKPLACRLGIEHVGRQFSRIGDLHDLGLDYLKIDASIVRGIDADAGNQSFVRGLCVVAHAIGLQVIAEGVISEAERKMLPGLGLDGMTGPAVSASGAGGGGAG